MEYDLGLIVQLRITGHLGSDEEAEEGFELELVLDELFQRHDCGMVDGNDIGSGTMNIFTNTNAANWDKALKVVLTELRRRNLHERAVIAKSVEVNDEREHSVVWPPDYRGEFSLF